MFINGEWGTVCSDNWSSYYLCAYVLCGELGYPKLQRYDTLQSNINDVQEGTGKIWLSNVNCTNQEHSIFECQQSGFGNHECGHSKDLAIICSTGHGMMRY